LLGEAEDKGRVRRGWRRWDEVGFLFFLYLFAAVAVLSRLAAGRNEGPIDVRRS
jgi:hypothetical protein